MLRAAAWAWLAVSCLGGCEAEARPLEWRIRFETTELASRAAMLEARIVRGMCGDPGAETIYAAVFALDGAAPSPGRLGPGPYGIEAYARDASCVTFASDCTTVRLPSRESAIDLVLRERPGSPACAADERCVTGVCEREPAPDAGRRDAAPQDTGPPDAGMCPTNATDGTGASCRRNTDCPSGLVCFTGGIGGAVGRCTRPCSASDDCVAGWVCGMASRFECPDGCAESPICRCPLFSLLASEESACDGADDDCDGRIDELSSDGEDPCGNGTCTCLVCACDPGWIACASRCVDTTTDPAHCGGCGDACPAGFACSGSTCVCNQTLCAGECVNTQTSETHCGECRDACVAGTTPRCCSGSCVDLAADPANCGSCGAVCAATEVCCAGTCMATACP